MISRAARRTVLVLGIIVSASASASARADDTAPARRFIAGLGMGPLIGFQTSVAGRSAHEPAGHRVNVLGTLGFDWSVVRWLALGIEAHAASWNSSWADATGYDAGHARALYDLDAVIRFRLPVPWQARTVTFSLSPTAGFTWPEAPSRDTRAVTESWQPRRGGNAGVDLTCEIWAGPVAKGSTWKLGVAAGIGYARHWFSLDGTSTPVADPGGAVTSRYDHVADQIMVKVAFLAGL